MKYIKILPIFKDVLKIRNFPSFQQYSDFKIFYLQDRYFQAYLDNSKYFQSMKCLDIIMFLKFKFQNSETLKILTLCSRTISNVLALRRLIQNSRILKVQRFWVLAWYRDKPWGCTKWRAEERRHKDAWQSWYTSSH